MSWASLLKCAWIWRASSKAADRALLWKKYIKLLNLGMYCTIYLLSFAYFSPNSHISGICNGLNGHDSEKNDFWRVAFQLFNQSKRRRLTYCTVFKIFYSKFYCKQNSIIVVLVSHSISRLSNRHFAQHCVYKFRRTNIGMDVDGYFVEIGSGTVNRGW